MGISAMWNAIIYVQDWTRVAVPISYDDNHYTTSFQVQSHQFVAWDTHAIVSLPISVS